MTTRARRRSESSYCLTLSLGGDPSENAIAVKLIDSDTPVLACAKSRGIERAILRPTLIYGFGRNKYISKITGFTRRFDFFLNFGQDTGLRQPFHAEDVAVIRVSKLPAPHMANSAYNASRNEMLTNRKLSVRASKSRTDCAYHDFLLDGNHPQSVIWSNRLPHTPSTTSALALSR